MMTVLVNTAQGERVIASSTPQRMNAAAAGGAGAPPAGMTRAREPLLHIAAPFALLFITMALGLYIPAFFDAALRQAALILGV
jgi:hypothetical protein